MGAAERVPGAAGDEFTRRSMTDSPFSQPRCGLMVNGTLVGFGRWSVGDGRRAGGRWARVDGLRSGGRWAMVSGRWAMGDGQIVDGRWAIGRGARRKVSERRH